MENKKSKKPFFASFLEKQIQDPEKVKGGTSPITSVLADEVTDIQKDNVTGVLRDNATSPGLDAVTMRYPSDSDSAQDLD
jgi:hypothetical protein